MGRYWIAIVRSGYIGLEFSDVYTALGSEVFIKINLMLRWMVYFLPKVSRIEITPAHFISVVETDSSRDLRV